jgi:hypothetical protein
MKKLFLLFVIFSAFACEKEPEVYNDVHAEFIENDQPWSLFYGKDLVVDGEPLPNMVEWQLVGGVMYMENMETGYKVKYDHFGPSRTKSSLRYSGAELEIEELELGVTTWQFKVNTMYDYEFILDKDSLNPYGYQESASYRSIIEHPKALSYGERQMGGSARPFVAYTKDYDRGLINIRIQEAYESIDGYNWNYFSVLTFKLID